MLENVAHVCGRSQQFRTQLRKTEWSYFVYVRFNRSPYPDCLSCVTGCSEMSTFVKKFVG